MSNILGLDRNIMPSLVAIMFAVVLHTSAASEPSLSETKRQAPVKVTALNYVVAKTALQFDKYLVMAKGQINTFSHRRSLVDAHAKSSKRLNRDTLYSVAIVDISKGATLKMPEPGDRYVSAQVVNEQGFTNKVFYGGGEFELTVDEFDTNYVWILIRTLVSEAIAGDLEAATELQDGMMITSDSSQPYAHPVYDPASFTAVTKLLVELGAAIDNNAGAAGSKEDVDPIMQLLTSAYGFGTLPETDSMLISVQPDLPIGQGYSLTVRDVPVNGFWSIAVYNKDGYFEPNDKQIYGVNDRTADRNEDGSVTVRFGGDASKDNFIPITEGWNYVVRLYRPRPEVLEGTWKIPEISKPQSSVN